MRARPNAVVRSCTSRGYPVGVHTIVGHGRLVADNRFDGNTGSCKAVYGANAKVRGNQRFASRIACGDVTTASRKVMVGFGTDLAAYRLLDNLRNPNWRRRCRCRPGRHRRRLQPVLQSGAREVGVSLAYGIDHANFRLDLKRRHL